MPGTDAAKFACPACGKQYAWKPELAGKKAKCKCGQTIAIPAAPQAMAAAAAPPPPRPAAPARAAAPPPAPAAGAYGIDDDDELAAIAALAKPVETGFNCPACQQPLTPGSVICISCGFNLKTGQRMTTLTGDAALDEPEHRPPGVHPGVVPPGGFAPFNPTPGALPPQPGRAPPQGKGLSKVLVPVILLVAAGVVVVVAIVGFRMFSGDGDGGSAAAPLKGQDKEVRRLMRDDDGTELKQWLSEGPSDRMVMGMTREKASGLADRLQDMGAVKIYAFGGKVTNVLAIELPSDPAKRQALFDWQKRWHEEMMVKPQVDEGQQYILLKMRF